MSAGDSHKGLHRQSDESADNHRAMLLWCAQRPGRRSMAAVGRILLIPGRQTTTMREKFGWRSRCAGVECATAIVVYKQLYGQEFGHIELRQLGDRIEGNLWNQPNEDQKAIAHDVASKAAQEAARQHAARKAEEQERAEAFQSIIDAAIIQLQDDVDNPNKTMKIGIRDLQGLVKSAEMLADRMEYLAGEKQRAEVVDIPESVRVKLARARDENVLDAVLLDIGEIKMLLEHMTGTNPQTAMDVAALNDALPPIEEDPEDFDDKIFDDDEGDPWQ